MPVQNGFLKANAEPCFDQKLVTETGFVNTEKSEFKQGLLKHHKRYATVKKGSPLPLHLHAKDDSQRQTEQKAQACDAETEDSHFGKTFFEGLIHSHRYVKVEQRNDEDGC